MIEQIKHRLDQLKAEYQAGQTLMADLDKKRGELQQTLLRIEGAVQVLQELLRSSSELTHST